MSLAQTKSWLKVSFAALVLGLISAVVLNIRAGYLADEYAGNGEEFGGATKDLAAWSVYFSLFMLTVNVSIVTIRRRSRKPKPL
ncbi:hypothetical protein ICM05_07220 [Leucobacter sp. cx-42]|uniref:hypothetical protein n=1 Tax=unclassified Leucobacter TaxID=2621730 RepID=UPI00165E424B|nr:MULTISPECIES: hypothetical protein [unclassified Leucobacter]MBC9954438.1 hypothetical protein [Leucobacter sp. cx-42]